MKRFLFSRPVGNGIRGFILLAMLLMSFGYGGANVAYALPPANDDFDSATQINAIEYHATIDTTEATPGAGATTGGDDPDNIACENGKVLHFGFASVWYKYTPPEKQGISLNTSGTLYDTFIAVWTGTRGNLSPVACNDETFEGFSELSFVGNAGTTYYIEVAQFNDGLGTTTNIGGSLHFNAYITNTTLKMAGTLKARYFVPETGVLRRSLISSNGGPLEIFNEASNQLIASQRVIYNVNGLNTSFSEMIGLPNNRVDNVYWLPWYNNMTLNTQLRIANVSGSTATIRVRIGGVEMKGNPFTLAPGASIRKTYSGINKGPVKIISNVNIVAAERVIYSVNGVDTSYSEMMALPESQLNKVYWLPWYNSKTMSSLLQIANVSASTATIRIAIGGKLMKGSPFTLASGKVKRLSFAGIDRGPVKIVSTVNIVASERVIYKVNTVPASLTEVMALPHSALDTAYWLPLYTQNSTVSTQLRIANTSSSAATVHVYIKGVQMAGSPFTLTVGGTKRLTFPKVDRGPVRITSNVKILAGARVILFVSGKPTSYSELIALPNKFLDSRYWMPSYNNIELNTQLRFAMP